MTQHDRDLIEFFARDGKTPGQRVLSALERVRSMERDVSHLAISPYRGDAPPTASDVEKSTDCFRAAEDLRTIEAHVRTLLYDYA